MKSVKIFIVTLTALLWIGCASTQMQSGFYQYTFNVDGKEYQIISATSAGNGKFNLLVNEEGNHTGLRAVDYEQDGKLDSIIVGDASLADANAIYEQGINNAEAKGSLNRQKYPRMYELDNPAMRYRIQTFIKDGNKIYNRFVVIDLKTLDQEVILDTNADGTLDRIEIGDKEMEHYQNLYKMTLIRGVQVGEIKHEDYVYIVPK